MDGVEAVEGILPGLDAPPCEVEVLGMDGEPLDADRLELGLLDEDELVLGLPDEDELVLERLDDEVEEEGELGIVELGELLLWLWDCCIVLQALSDSKVATARISVHCLNVSLMAASIASPESIFSNNS